MAIFFYLFLILNGQMIGLPFFIWLLYTLFDFGNSDQLFAFVAVAGLVLICINHNKTRTVNLLIGDIFYFFLLSSPLARRMTAVPIELFYDGAFLIPAALFPLFYLASFYFGFRQYEPSKAGSN